MATSAALLEENRSLRRIIQEKDLRILELEKQLGFIQTQPQNPIEKITETIPDEESSKRDQLFGIIKEKLKEKTTIENIRNTKTNNGDTQISERKTIRSVKMVLDDLGLSYTQAGSQQSKDFRNVGGIGLNIEIKKTDSDRIKFNDTPPSKDIYYIIFHPGKTYKRKKNIPPQIIAVNGSYFIDSSPWITSQYLPLVNILKDLFGRGSNAKNLPGVMSAYARPNMDAKITELLEC